MFQNINWKFEKKNHITQKVYSIKKKKSGQNITDNSKKYALWDL